MTRVVPARHFTCWAYGRAETARVVSAISPAHAARLFRQGHDVDVAEWPEERLVTVRDHATHAESHWVVACVPEPSYTARPAKKVPPLP